MFDDLQMNDSYREPTKAEIRAEKDREYNYRMKNTMRVMGENMATCTIVLAASIIIGSVFGSVGINVFSEYMLMDFLITFAGYLVIEFMASKGGLRCGKTYPEYIDLHSKYIDMREEIYKRGIALMDMFCDWQVDVEYEQYMRHRCKKLKIDYSSFVDVYSKMSIEDLSNMFTHKGEEKPKFSLKHPIRTAIAIHNYTKVSELAKDIIVLKTVKPIELTPEILLTDGKPRRTRGGVGISGEEHLEQHTTGLGHIIVTIPMVLLTIFPAFMSKGFTWGMLFVAAIKLVGVVMRYYRGFSRGAKAYNTVEIKHLQDKIQYFHLYNEYLDKKIYLDLEEKYGKLPESLKKETGNEDKRCDSSGGCVEAQHNLAGAEVHVDI